MTGHTVECKCKRRIAVTGFIFHYLDCPAIPKDHRWLMNVALRSLARNLIKGENHYGDTKHKKGGCGCP